MNQIQDNSVMFKAQPTFLEQLDLGNLGQLLTYTPKQLAGNVIADDKKIVNIVNPILGCIDEGDISVKQWIEKTFAKCGNVTNCIEVSSIVFDKLMKAEKQLEDSEYMDSNALLRSYSVYEENVNEILISRHRDIFRLPKDEHGKTILSTIKEEQPKNRSKQHVETVQTEQLGNVVVKQFKGTIQQQTDNSFSRQLNIPSHKMDEVKPIAKKEILRQLHSLAVETINSLDVIESSSSDSEDLALFRKEAE